VAWARIDDGFDDHPKVLALLDMEDGAAAIGLWTLCLTWAHRNTRRKGKVPGLIPSTLPRRFVGAEGRRLADLLVNVGLWEQVDDGWLIHDFAEYLPSAEVSAARSAAGKKGAAKRWGKQTDGNLPSGSHAGDGKLPSSGYGNLPSVSHVEDGSLPSVCHPVDGKRDGKTMAHDGRSAPGAAKNLDVETTGGMEPSPDSKLPSGSHGGDGKPMAKPLGYIEVSSNPLIPVPNPVPNPVSIPPSAGTASPRRAKQSTNDPNAGAIVAAWVEAATAATGERPANRLINQVGRQAKELLAEGKNPDRLIEAAASAGRKGFTDLGRELLRTGATKQATGTNGHRPYQNPPDPSVYFEDL